MDNNKLEQAADAINTRQFHYYCADGIKGDAMNARDYLNRCTFHPGQIKQALDYIYPEGIDYYDRFMNVDEDNEIDFIVQEVLNVLVARTLAQTNFSLSDTVAFTIHIKPR